jgi:hypothetical protein
MTWTTTGGALLRGVDPLGMWVFGAGMIFSNSTDWKINCGNVNQIVFNNNYTVVGDCPGLVHLSQFTTYVHNGSLTVTVNGTPAWSDSMFNLTSGGYAYIGGTTWSGSATGKRYAIIQNGMIDTGVQATTWLPGNVAGITASQGQYL